MGVHSPNKRVAMHCSGKCPWERLDCQEFSKFPELMLYGFLGAPLVPNCLKKWNFRKQIPNINAIFHFLPQHLITSNDWELVADLFVLISSKISSMSLLEIRPERLTSWSSFFNELSRLWFGFAIDANPLKWYRDYKKDFYKENPLKIDFCNSDEIFSNLKVEFEILFVYLTNLTKNLISFHWNFIQNHEWIAFRKLSTWIT